MLVNLTEHGRSLVSDVAARFETEIYAVLHRRKPHDRGTLSRLVSRLLVAHESDHGIDVLSLALVTYAVEPSAPNAVFHGVAPTRIRSTVRRDELSITTTASRPFLDGRDRRRGSRSRVLTAWGADVT